MDAALDDGDLCVARGNILPIHIKNSVILENGVNGDLVFCGQYPFCDIFIMYLVEAVFPKIFVCSHSQHSWIKVRKKYPFITKRAVELLYGGFVKIDGRTQDKDEEVSNIMIFGILLYGILIFGIFIFGN